MCMTDSDDTAPCTSLLRLRKRGLNMADSFLSSATNTRSSLPETTSAPAPPHALADAATQHGVTLRVVVLCLGLSALFGYIIPVIDYKLSLAFLGGTHL